ncbi:hypothetical protein [Rufibacter tibetensis]|uniref:Uncharacterized protein n=1 Tax=Rufibacter tibetensis TaxID=512763 RepID=A0A0P0CBG5_9BACT|nr:hypothetical protein [Rufibacter tibetensis]ALJ01000.1 hypothetical protein DC20_20910 [Rufibacter tibetensis]
MILSLLRKAYNSIFGTDASSFLRAQKVPIDCRAGIHLKRIPEVDSRRIPTYPRFTVYDLDISEGEDQLIFDSSDFDVVNARLGGTIQKGGFLQLGPKRYLVADVQVELMGCFDDYSLDQYCHSGGIHRHSKVYQGRPVPYNVLMVTKVRRAVPATTLPGTSWEHLLGRATASPLAEPLLAVHQG